MSEYKEFASVYDMMQYDVDYKKWFINLDAIIRKYTINSKKILELACGTGTLSIEFSMSGYLVEGVDISAEMLAEASFKARDKGQKIRFYCQNMSMLNTSKKYDVIFSMCDGINYLTDYEELNQMFERVLEHLEEDGLFVFDFSSEYKLSEIIGNNTFAETFDDSAYIWENEYDKTEKILSFSLTLFKNVQGAYERFEEYHEQRAFSVNEMKNISERHFKVLEILDGDSFEPLSPKAERVLFVCKKK